MSELLHLNSELDQRKQLKTRAQGQKLVKYLLSVH